nr:keratin, type I cytoskeletal 9-like [Dermatophagoides farinae]
MCKIIVLTTFLLSIFDLTVAGGGNAGNTRGFSGFSGGGGGGQYGRMMGGFHSSGLGMGNVFHHQQIGGGVMTIDQLGAGRQESFNGLGPELAHLGTGISSAISGGIGAFMGLQGRSSGGGGGYNAGGGGGGNSGYSGSSRGGGRINAAVFSKQTFETKPVQSQFGPIEPQIIEIEGSDLPVEIVFKSASGRIKVRQEHRMQGAGETEYNQFEEEPHRLVTEVRKPIIQEVREIISPQRKVYQEIEPVIEEIHTIVAEGQGGRGSGGNYGGSNGGGNYGNSGGFMTQQRTTEYAAAKAKAKA